MRERAGNYKRAILPFAPLRERGIYTRDEILKARQSELSTSTRERTHCPSAQVRDKQETAPASETLSTRPFYDIPGKVSDIYTNRRQFISRGFIGSALVFTGAARVSRSTLFLTLDHREEIVESPKHIDEIPGYISEGAKASREYLRQVPSYAERVPAYAEEVTEAVVETIGEIPQFIQDQADEIQKVDFDSGICEVNGERKKLIDFDIPYLDSDIDDPLCVERLSDTQRYVSDGNQSPEVEESKNPTGDLVKIGIGGGMMLVGSKIATHGDHSIPRWKIGNRMISGIVVGLMTLGLDSDVNPLKDKLPNR